MVTLAPPVLQMLSNQRHKSLAKPKLLTLLLKLASRGVGMGVWRPHYQFHLLRYAGQSYAHDACALLSLYWLS